MKKFTLFRQTQDNLQFKNFLHSTFLILHSKKAFTLVEVLITIFILGVIGVVMADLLARSFKNNNEIQLSSTLKQNGQTALNIMDQAIRNSDSIVCISGFTNPPLSNRIIMIRKDNIFTRFIMYPPTSSSNGVIVKDSPTISDPSSEELVSQACDSTIANANALTNTDTQVGVSLINGSFILQGNNAVTIQFTLGSPINSGITDTAGGSFVDFQTTVQLR